MSTNLYFMSDGAAFSMTEHRYETEGELQKIIADNPGLLVRDADPDRSSLMLIEREFEVPESGDSSNAYYLDHLLVDQSGVPVLVEVKRSTDTRTRREVVAQMLDYASRVSTWDADDLRERFRASNEPETLEAYDTDKFWEQVATCLKAERVKLVFAADRIPNTLKTMIEFLDRSMNDIEVYGVELRQYKTDDATMLTSSVAGETPLKLKQTTTRSIEWDAASFSAFLLNGGRQDAIPLVNALSDFFINIGLSCHHSRGSKFPAFYAKIGTYKLFTVSSWKKSGQLLCTFDTCIHNIVSYLGGNWTESDVRELLTEIPGQTKGRSNQLIWDTPQYLYIDLMALSEDEDMTAFQTGLKKLVNAIVEK